jgi:hypothetical protein
MYTPAAISPDTIDGLASLVRRVVEWVAAVWIRLSENFM